MRNRHLACAMLFLTFTSQSVSAARFEGQFDLVCIGKAMTGGPFTPRFSVDIGRGLFCTRSNAGECVQKPPKEIAQITPESLVFVDSPPTEERSRYRLSVSSANDEIKIEIYKPEGVLVFARATCRSEAFAPFPPIPAR